MTVNTVNRIAPFAVEASWATGRWQTLEKYLRMYNAGDVSEVFNLGVGQALLCLRDGNVDQFKEHIRMLREKVASSMTYSTTSSLRASHDAMLKCHVLSELEMIADEKTRTDGDPQAVLRTLHRRLEVLGAYVSDKQYLLGIRRAAMELMRCVCIYLDRVVCEHWLTLFFQAKIRQRRDLVAMARQREAGQEIRIHAPVLQRRAPCPAAR